jgi:hypothetical protein
MQAAHESPATMIFSFRALCLGALFMLTGCVAMKVAEFESGRPLLDPAQFFAGRTSSSGVLEDRGGAPMKRVTTQTAGRWEGDWLYLEQDLETGGKKQHRSWRIRKLDAHHYEATANDLVGMARGEAYGNVFHWSFTLALSPRNPFAQVRMSQWMYLQRTAALCSIIRRSGSLGWSSRR